MSNRARRLVLVTVAAMASFAGGAVAQQQEDTPPAINLMPGIRQELERHYGTHGPALHTLCAFGARVGDRYLVLDVEPRTDDWNCGDRTDWVGIYVLLPQLPRGLEGTMVPLSCRWVDALVRRTGSTMLFAVVVYGRQSTGGLTVAMCYLAPTKRRDRSTERAG